jgi:hypothetical protein
MANMNNTSGMIHFEEMSFMYNDTRELAREMLHTANAEKALSKIMMGVEDEDTIEFNLQVEHDMRKNALLMLGVESDMVADAPKSEKLSERDLIAYLEGFAYRIEKGEFDKQFMQMMVDKNKNIFNNPIMDTNTNQADDIEEIDQALNNKLSFMPYEFRRGNYGTHLHAPVSFGIGGSGFGSSLISNFTHAEREVVELLVKEFEPKVLFIKETATDVNGRVVNGLFALYTIDQSKTSEVLELYREVQNRLQKVNRRNTIIRNIE